MDGIQAMLRSLGVVPSGQPTGRPIVVMPVFTQPPTGPIVTGVPPVRPITPQAPPQTPQIPQTEVEELKLRIAALEATKAAFRTRVNELERRGEIHDNLFVNLRRQIEDNDAEVRKLHLNHVQRCKEETDRLTGYLEDLEGRLGKVESYLNDQLDKEEAEPVQDTAARQPVTTPPPPETRSPAPAPDAGNAPTGLDDEAWLNLVRQVAEETGNNPAKVDKPWHKSWLVGQTARNRNVFSARFWSYRDQIREAVIEAAPDRDRPRFDLFDDLANAVVNLKINLGRAIELAKGLVVSESATDRAPQAPPAAHRRPAARAATADVINPDAHIKINDKFSRAGLTLEGDMKEILVPLYRGYVKQLEQITPGSPEESDFLRDIELTLNTLLK